MSKPTEICEQILNDCLASFQKHKVTVQDILTVYGQLGYSLGASIEGHQGVGPSIDDLNQAYYTSPTVGVALMIQGLQTMTWIDDLNKQLADTNQQTSEDETEDD